MGLGPADSRAAPKGHTSPVGSSVIPANNRTPDSHMNVSFRVPWSADACRLTAAGPTRASRGRLPGPRIADLWANAWAGQRTQRVYPRLDSARRLPTIPPTCDSPNAQAFPNVLTDITVPREPLRGAQAGVQAGRGGTAWAMIAELGGRHLQRGGAGVGQPPKGRRAEGGGTSPREKGSSQVPRAAARHGHATSLIDNRGASRTRPPGQMAQRDPVRSGQTEEAQHT